MLEGNVTPNSLSKHNTNILDNLQKMQKMMSTMPKRSVSFLPNDDVKKILGSGKNLLNVKIKNNASNEKSKNVIDKNKIKNNK